MLEDLKDRSPDASLFELFDDVADNVVAMMITRMGRQFLRFVMSTLAPLVFALLPPILRYHGADRLMNAFFAPPALADSAAPRAIGPAGDG